MVLSQLFLTLSNIIKINLQCVEFCAVIYFIRSLFCCDCEPSTKLPRVSRGSACLADITWWSQSPEPVIWASLRSQSFSLSFLSKSHCRLRDRQHRMIVHPCWSTWSVLERSRHVDPSAGVGLGNWTVISSVELCFLLLLCNKNTYLA